VVVRVPRAPHVIRARVRPSQGKRPDDSSDPRGKQRFSRIIGRSFERRVWKSRGRTRDDAAAANYTSAGRVFAPKPSAFLTVARTREEGGRAEGIERWQRREREGPRAFPRTEVEGHPNYPAIGFDGMR